MTIVTDSTNRETKKRLEPGTPVFWQAILAIDGSSFGWFKGNFTFFSAV
jgi:hypothetical protein